VLQPRRSGGGGAHPVRRAVGGPTRAPEAFPAAHATDERAGGVRRRLGLVGGPLGGHVLPPPPEELGATGPRPERQMVQARAGRLAGAGPVLDTEQAVALQQAQAPVDVAFRQSAVGGQRGHLDPAHGVAHRLAGVIGAAGQRIGQRPAPGVQPQLGDDLAHLLAPGAPPDPLALVLLNVPGGCYGVTDLVQIDPPRPESEGGSFAYGDRFQPAGGGPSWATLLSGPPGTGRDGVSDSPGASPGAGAGPLMGELASSPSRPGPDPRMDTPAAPATAGLSSRQPGARPA